MRSLGVEPIQTHAMTAPLFCIIAAFLSIHQNASDSSDLLGGREMASESSIQEFIKSANWLFELLREKQPLTEKEEQTVDGKIRALSIEWDTWKRWNEGQRKPRRGK